jgi:hypothetical protein
VAVSVEKAKILVFHPRNLLISLAVLFEEMANMDFFDSLASYQSPYRSGLT